MDRVLELVAGVSGTGKSYFIKNTLLPELNKADKPVIVFDRMGEYAGAKATDVPKKWNNYAGAIDFFNAIQANEGYLTKDIHVIQCESDRDYIQGLEFFHQLRQPVSLVVDEAHDLYASPDFKTASRALTNVVRYGRKFGIDVIFITQRTMDVPPDVRSQFQGNVISFKQTLQNDIEALNKMGIEQADKVLDLDHQEYHIFGELPKRIKI
jgi:hypothetical protein